MSFGPNYNPIPPRVWSRVQNKCTYLADVSTNINIETLYQEQLYYKGNILQYKKNSSNLTKNQRYSQINKGLWTNRRKSWATQSDKYTNPNTSSLKRVGSEFYSYPNNLIGKPNNPAGPFVVNVPNPFDCSTNLLEDGGNLICTATVNQCSGETIEETTTLKCYPTYYSDVPGKVQLLCWDNKFQTYYPRQRYFMTNSGTKWPEGYKGFVSAVKPESPILDSSVNNCIIYLSWDQPISCQIFGSLITNYLIYVNDVLYDNVPSNIKNYSFTAGTGIYYIYVVAVINTTESITSNIVVEAIALPTSLSVTNNAPNTATLSWNQPNSSVSSFNIYRSTSGGPYTQIANVLVAPFPMNYIDNTLNNNITYSYYITTLDGSCESIPSNVVSVTPLTLYTVTGNPTQYQSGGYYWVIYDISGTFNFNYNLNMEFSLIGGGSGGGYISFNSSGTAAGGGGHVVSTNASRVVNPNNWTITIGKGGAGATGTVPTGSGETGGNTSIVGTSFSVATNNNNYGGGYGLNYINYTYRGGGGIGNGTTSVTGGSYDITSYNAGGGGGGSLTLVNNSNVYTITTLGGPGLSGSSSGAGKGGNGQMAIDGIYYGGGGGGGAYYTNTIGTGGNGGGGNGANYSNNSGNGSISGGAGGGGSYYTSGSIIKLPGSGANGRVILKFNQA